MVSRRGEPRSDGKFHLSSLLNIAVALALMGIIGGVAWLLRDSENEDAAAACWFPGVQRISCDHLYGFPAEKQGGPTEGPVKDGELRNVLRVSHEGAVEDGKLTLVVKYGPCVEWHIPMRVRGNEWDQVDQARDVSRCYPEPGQDMPVWVGALFQHPFTSTVVDDDTVELQGLHASLRLEWASAGRGR